MAISPVCPQEKEEAFGVSAGGSDLIRDFSRGALIVVTS